MKLDASAAPTLVRDARLRATLTQSELARRAGVQQSNIAAIESGARTVSAELLERILAASGYRPSYVVADHREQISALGAEYGIVNIRLFGSVARGDDDYQSDVDLLVDLLPSDVPFRLATFKDELERMLGVDVDVVIDAEGRRGIEHIRQTAVAV